MNEVRLSEVLSEFARTLATDFPIQRILDHLVRRIVDVLPIDAAGVTLISPGVLPHLVAASNDAALRFERLQTELGEGPCLAAYETDGPISIPDLAEDKRFPVFAERALAEGLVAVFTFPLRHGDRGLGALDLYRETAGPLDAGEMAAAQTLADVATAYLLNARARDDLRAVSETERTALARLREIDRTKTEFLATVIHELRTPMTSITGYTELLTDGDSGALNPDQRRLVDAITRNSHRLKALADDLLTLARLEEGAALEEHCDLDLRDVVRVDGDARSLERMVSNLMTNALKFTDDGGWVRCLLRAEAGVAQLQVSDSGIGIPPEERDDLFTRFFRGAAARRKKVAGSGLGLNIIRSIAHNHGGRVSVDSVHRQGTTFTVTLPLLERLRREPATGPTAYATGKSK
jgi:signal transduction histidine kinase